MRKENKQLKVIKRDGSLVPFDQSKIYNAIGKAMEDVNDIDIHIASEIANQIADEVEHYFEIQGQYLTVENISDMTEDKLMDLKAHKVAKAYILYRNEHQEIREYWKPYREFKYLSRDFLKKYAKRADPFKTELGKVTFYRTYSRYIPEVNRRETWLEMNARVANYIVKLDPMGNKEKAEELFDYLYNMKVLSSGRVRYIADTEAVRRNFQSVFNCAFMVMDDIFNIVEQMYIMLLGVGGGYRILKSDVEKMHPVRQDVKVTHLAYSGADILKNDRIESTTTSIDDDVLTINIADSKQGWVTALRIYLEVLTNYKRSSSHKVINEIKFNYDNIRPQGEKLETFGGTSSGFAPLQKSFKGIDRVIKNSDGKKLSRKRVKLEPIDIMDINGLVAQAIVVGGVRRSAMLAIIDRDDEKCIRAKENLYTQEDGKWTANKDILHRQLSNNSIAYYSKPDREEWHEHMKKIRYTGEPAAINYEELLRRDPDGKGLNPLTL